MAEGPHLSLDVIRSGQHAVRTGRHVGLPIRVAGLGPAPSNLHKSRLGVSGPDGGSDSGIGAETVQYNVRSSDERTVLIAEEAAGFPASSWSAAPGDLEARLAEPTEVGYRESRVVIFNEESGSVAVCG